MAGYKSAKGMEPWRVDAEASPAPVSPHNPQPLSAGTVKCCGQVYAKHAHLAHLRGESIHEWQSGIGVVAADQVTQVSEMERARLYSALNQRPERGAVRVDGAEDSIYGF
jgi:hypothetical protein